VDNLALDYMATQKSMKHEKLKLSFNLAQAYLEMARAFHNVRVCAPKGIFPKGVRSRNNTVFAVAAHGYVFSFMAVTAFVNGRLGESWEHPNSALRKKHPKCRNVIELLKHLWTLENCINELCLQYKIKCLRDENPKLWKDFHEVVKRTRDFMTHPKPEQVEFNKITGDAFGKRSWAFPSKVAEEVIGYFYDAQGYTKPPWLKENQEFQIPIILALSVAKRE
jgi:hypothetical protein